MSTHKGRAVRVEVAATYGSAKTVSAITKANPGVATSTGHGLSEGAIGYFSNVLGMVELEGQVASVDSTATNTFNLEDIDTSAFGTFSGSCDFTPVSTWSLLSTATAYEISGGTADQLDASTLLDNSRVVETGMLAAQTVQIDSLSDMQLAAINLVRSAARSPNTRLIFRITLSNGERRIFRGLVTMPGEQLSLSQIATSGFTVLTTRQVLMAPAA